MRTESHVKSEAVKHTRAARMTAQDIADLKLVETRIQAARKDPSRIVKGAALDKIYAELGI